MKKVFLPLLTALAFVGLTNEVKAQTPFKSALGIVFDGYDGSQVGIQYKTALKGPQAAQFQASFGNHYVTIGADWQYERPIQGAEGLAWYAGIGAQVGFWSYKGYSETYIGLRPQIGLEYRIPTMPIAFHLDYKPNLGLTHSTGFQGGGFTFGVKYVLK